MGGVGVAAGDLSADAARGDGRTGGDAGEVLAAMARAGTAGARGNSGIILSQVLRGLAEAVRSGPLTARNLRAALRRAAVLVRAALSRPVEGTMLSVLEAAADRAADCPDAGLSEVARAAADGAFKALGDTPSQLGVLRAAGVVDAGARGLSVVLDALVGVITGRTPERQEYRSDTVPGSGSAVRQDDRPGTVHDGSETTVRREDRPNAVDDISESGVQHGHSAASEFAVAQYEVMYLLSGTTGARIGELREHLARLGDSVVVVGDGADGWSAHVHCADAGAAVEAGLAAGTLSRIRIEGLTVSPLAAQGSPDRGIIAVAAGAGAARLFEDSGATVLDGEVTPEVLLAAIRRMPQREVLVLPNGALAAHELVAVGMAARAGAAPREVLMLPSGSMVQGLAALAVHDAGRIAVDDAFAMSEAAAGTRWGALRIARERALTIVGTCARGDGLGLVGNDVVVIDPEPRAAARTLLDRMLGLGGELVTLLLGADAPGDLAEDLAEHITATFPGVEVVAYTGGQPLDIVQIGVE
jgi:DAK2 domain fusion protein YloV